MAGDEDLIRRHARPVPRYTSYPTANHFSPGIGPVHYVDWLAAVEPGAALSLYVHIPFCQELCFYCACSTRAVRRREPVDRYMDVVATEIGNVSGLLAKGVKATHVHWGGGSPNILAADGIARLDQVLRAAFDVVAEAEYAVEIDPRHLEPEQVRAFAAAGVNRVSLGVQDFDPAVQRAIGRRQSLDQTRRAIDLCRAAGVGSVNVDLVYGLPHQTLDSLARTIDNVVALAPDRIAAFGYAHLPERVKSQRLIDGATLPDAVGRFALADRMSRMLGAAGYQRIGIDHFARAGDDLASRPLRRNFQGYTSDAADRLLGFGASAIGKLDGGYVQNAVPAGRYAQLIAEHGLATQRGIVLSADDHVRAFVIERLMCDFHVSAKALVALFGEAARPVLARAAEIIGHDEDGIFTVTGDGFSVTDRGRPFVRSICASFDRYLGASETRHSSAV